MDYIERYNKNKNCASAAEVVVVHKGNGLEGRSVMSTPPTFAALEAGGSQSAVKDTRKVTGQ